MYILGQLLIITMIVMLISWAIAGIILMIQEAMRPCRREQLGYRCKGRECECVDGN